jgi:hypothetical protein
MSPLNTEDKEKFNQLYSSISKIPIPEFTDPDAVQMGKDVKEGLQIINKAIKEVSQIIK